jgi:hypothetical protein
MNKVLEKLALITAVIFMFVVISTGCSANRMTHKAGNIDFTYQSSQIISSSTLNNSSSPSTKQTGDIFMQYVLGHNYKIIPDSEAGGQVYMIYFSKETSGEAAENANNNPDNIGIQMIAIFNNAYISSKKLGFDFIKYQGDVVDFHTCGIDLGSGKSAEADCFTYKNQIIGFWIFTPPANTNKQDYDSYLILNSDSAAPEISYSISNIDFLSSNIGYSSVGINTISYKGETFSNKLAKTTDGGKNWSTINNNIPVRFINFIDEKTGFGFTENQTLEKTDDGGLSWQPTGFLNGKYIYSMNIISSKVMFLITGAKNQSLYGSCFDQVFRTEDGGQSWAKINLPSPEIAFYTDDFSWLSSQEGYTFYCGNAQGDLNKTLYYTNNGGKTWSIKAKDNSNKIASNLFFGDFSCGMKFFQNGVGYIGFDYGPLIKTNDSGVHFIDLPLEYENNDTEGVHLSNPVPDFINSQEGYALFFRGGLFHTTNGGQNWTEILSNSSIQSIMSK